jgi:hypothetical protein
MATAAMTLRPTEISLAALGIRGGTPEGLNLFQKKSTRVRKRSFGPRPAAKLMQPRVERKSVMASMSLFAHVAMVLRLTSL